MPVGREEFRESVAQRLEAFARERRKAAEQATSEEERRRLNHGSADLLVAAERVRATPNEHADFSGHVRQRS